MKYRTRCNYSKPGLGVNALSCTVSTTNSILIQETIAFNIAVHTNLYSTFQGDGGGITQNLSLPENINNLHLYNFVDVNISNSNNLDTISRMSLFSVFRLSGFH